jgi:hypothetical protein
VPQTLRSGRTHSGSVGGSGFGNTGIWPTQGAPVALRIAGPHVETLRATSSPSPMSAWWTGFITDPFLQRSTKLNGKRKEQNVVSLSSIDKEETKTPKTRLP